MTKLSVIISLIRWKNLLMLALGQVLFKYLLFPAFETPTKLSSVLFFILVLATCLLAGGGYIINDIFDVECDAINKPHKRYVTTLISKKNALLTYWTFTITGLILSTYLSFVVQKHYFSFIFISIAIGLYYYSSHLKKKPLKGNLFVSFLVALNTLILAPFEIDITKNTNGLYLLIQFSFFSFYINLLREIIKDLEDIKGDLNAKMNTLPIYIGSKRTKKILLCLSFILICFLILFITNGLVTFFWKKAFFVEGIISPFLYFMYKLYVSKTTKHFHKLSALLKYILVFGLLFILIISL